MNCERVFSNQTTKSPKNVLLLRVLAYPSCKRVGCTDGSKDAENRYKRDVGFETGGDDLWMYSGRWSLAKEVFRDEEVRMDRRKGDGEEERT